MGGTDNTTDADTIPTAALNDNPYFCEEVSFIASCLAMRVTPEG